MSGRRHRKIRAAPQHQRARWPVRGPVSPWPRQAPPGAQVQVWHIQTCPGCRRDVAYLEGQQVNACGWDDCPRQGQPLARRP